MWLLFASIAFGFWSAWSVLLRFYHIDQIALTLLSYGLLKESVSRGNLNHSWNPASLAWVNTMMLDIYEIIGVTGVVIVVISYLLLNISVFHQTSLYYQLANLVGAAFILFSTIGHWNLATFCIEVVWILISLFGMVKILSCRSDRTE